MVHFSLIPKFDDSEEKKCRILHDNSLFNSISKLSLSFDKRMKLFKRILAHRKKYNQPLHLKDIFHWFWEAKNDDIYKYSVVPFSVIEKNIEAFLAELIERKQSQEE